MIILYIYLNEFMETPHLTSSQEKTREEKVGIVNDLIATLQAKKLLEKSSHLDRGKHFPKNAQSHLQLHSEHLNKQIREAQEAIDNGEVIASTHKFDHTIRDGHKFDTDKASVRYQLAFSPLDPKTPFLLPVSERWLHETVTIHSSVYDRKRIPHELITAFLQSTFLPEQLKKGLPASILEPQKIKRLHLILMQEPKYMDAFKAYLALGNPLSYLIDTESTEENPDGFVERTTPRVISLPDKKILLIQHANKIYTEKHLSKYTGTDFFFKVFSSPKAYWAYEQKTLQLLQDNNERFDDFAVRIRMNFCSHAQQLEIKSLLLSKKLVHDRANFDRIIKQQRDIFSKRLTTTDQKLTDLCDKILNSKHPVHIAAWMSEALQQIKKRQNSREKMQAAIQDQYPQV
jgi:hypothetical protein